MSYTAETSAAIAEFLRDAQYRYAELSFELSQRRNKKVTEIALKRKQLKELCAFFNLLYVERYDFVSGDINVSPWTEAELIAQMEKFRLELNINVQAIGQFTGHTPNIFIKVQDLTQIGINGSITSGAVGLNAVYSGEREISAEDPVEAVGSEGLTANQYFNLDD